MKKHLPTILTLLNAVAGTLSIELSFTHSLPAAAVLIVCAVVLDGMDGAIARAMGTASPLGASLDSLADVISFGVAPSVLAFAQFPENPAFIVIGAVFVACGVYRLARFSVLPKGPAFVGVPITVNGILFPLLFMIGATEEVTLLALAAMSILMVSTLRVPRLF